MAKYPAAPPPRTKYPNSSGNIASLGGTLTTEQIAVYLSAAAGRPVLDKTSLAGRYSFFLTYMPNLQQADGDALQFGPPGLFAAIQEQLGLKMQPSKAEVTVVVVDQMDRTPTES